MCTKFLTFSIICNFDLFQCLLFLCLYFPPMNKKKAMKNLTKRWCGILKFLIVLFFYIETIVYKKSSFNYCSYCPRDNLMRRYASRILFYLGQLEMWTLNLVIYIYFIWVCFDTIPAPLMRYFKTYIVIHFLLGRIYK